MSGDNWGGVIRCACCGTYARTNCEKLLNGTERWMCWDCELDGGDDTSEPDYGVVLLPVDPPTDDTRGMERLL